MIGFRFGFYVSLLVIVMGCERSKQSPEALNVAEINPIKAKCLPCVDHEVVVDKDTPTTEYRGKRYYFCSEACKSAFTMEPEKWVVLSEKDALKPAQNALSTRP